MLYIFERFIYVLVKLYNYMKVNLNTGLAIIQTILLLVVVLQLSKLGTLPIAEQIVPQEAPAMEAPEAPVQRIEASADDDPALGDKNAPVTIIEFSDFQCPFCARFHQQTFPQINEEYVKKGKVRFVYRDYPLPFHQFAQKASEAAECADEQGKFWQYHEEIFKNQQALSIENLKKWATDLGLDSKKFNGCLDSGKMAAEVQKDLQEGGSYGASGTPAFFINGKLISGAQPYQAFKQAIDSELAS